MGAHLCFADTEVFGKKAASFHHMCHKCISALAIVWTRLGRRYIENGVTEFHIVVQHAIREALATNANALEHAVALELVQHQFGLDQA